VNRYLSAALNNAPGVNVRRTHCVPDSFRRASRPVRCDSPVQCVGAGSRLSQEGERHLHRGFLPKLYPFADQANGGSLKGMLEAADLIAKLADPQTTLIPGHGTLIKEQNLLPYKSMVADILAR
jgi:hypothetical protein